MFEFDESKSKSNKDKHGIDVETAIQLWNDPNRLEIPARSMDEPRFIMIAKFEDEYWSTIFTRRNDNVRIISVRKSRENEKEIYNSF